MSRIIDYTVLGKLSPDLTSLEIDHAEPMKRLLKNLEGLTLEINIKRFFHQRSLAQNRWIWGICITTIQAWLKETNGEFPDKDTVYAFLRIRVVGHGVVIREMDGFEVPVIEGKRFSQMTTVEFSDAVEKIVEYYALRGLEVPLPKPKGNNLINEYLNDE